MEEVKRMAEQMSQKEIDELIGGGSNLYNKTKAAEISGTIQDGPTEAYLIKRAISSFNGIPQVSLTFQVAIGQDKDTKVFVNQKIQNDEVSYSYFKSMFYKLGIAPPKVLKVSVILKTLDEAIGNRYGIAAKTKTTDSGTWQNIYINRLIKVATLKTGEDAQQTSENTSFPSDEDLEPDITPDVDIKKSSEDGTEEIEISDKELGIDPPTEPDADADDNDGGDDEFELDFDDEGDDAPVEEISFEDDESEELPKKKTKPRTKKSR